MAKIKMKSPAAAQSALTFEQLYERFLIDRTAQGLAEKTLQSDRTHLKSIAKHLDITLPFGKLSAGLNYLLRKQSSAQAEQLFGRPASPQITSLPVTVLQRPKR